MRLRTTETRFNFVAGLAFFLQDRSVIHEIQCVNNLHAFNDTPKRREFSVVGRYTLLGNKKSTSAGVAAAMCHADNSTKMLANLVLVITFALHFISGTAGPVVVGGNQQRRSSST